MKVVQLHRDGDDKKQSLGRWYVFDDQTIVFHCKTLELPYRDNKRSISAIPPGKYICKWTYSNAFKRMMYLVADVPNRSGIRIHPANRVEELRGCIALGSEHKDMDLDGDMDVIHSGATCKAFEKIMDGLNFKLEVYDFT